MNIVNCSDENETAIRHGTWADSNTEIILKSIVSFSKNYQCLYFIHVWNSNVNFCSINVLIHFLTIDQEQT